MFFPARKVARAVNCSPFGLVVGSMQMMIYKLVVSETVLFIDHSATETDNVRVMVSS